VTNALPIAMALSARANVTVLIVGGRVRGRMLAAVDEWATRLLHDTYIDVAFVGADGVSVERGLATRDTAEAAVKRGMIAAAGRTVVLADDTKLGNNQSARFANLDAVDVVITDSGLDETTAGELGAAGPRVVRA
jgi:DeoR family transcriptional regulator, fructose operon transcriptional repressor